MSAFSLKSSGKPKPPTTTGTTTGLLPVAAADVSGQVGGMPLNGIGVNPAQGGRRDLRNVWVSGRAELEVLFLECSLVVVSSPGQYSDLPGFSQFGRFLAVHPFHFRRGSCLVAGSTQKGHKNAFFLPVVGVSDNFW